MRMSSPPRCVTMLLNPQAGLFPVRRSGGQYGVRSTVESDGPRKVLVEQVRQVRVRVCTRARGSTPLSLKNLSDSGHVFPLKDVD